MAILIQSLSWALIYSLGQGFVLYAALWLVLKLMPTTQANVKYHLSLSTLTVLLVWFASTWWQQYHSIALANEHALTARGWDTITLQQLQAAGIIDNNVWYYSLSTTINVIFPWLSAFYIAGLALMLVRLSSGILGLFSLRNSGITQAGTAMDELLASLKRRMHLAGNVRLLISAKAQVPMVLGFIKPIILVPAAVMAQLSTEQLETIILHELAHIKRHDYLVNILQTVVETILFFNPFAWLISAVTRREREHCCDDLVLAHSPEPLYYATALAALASNTDTATTFAIAATGQSNHLFNRIKRIMEMKKNPFSYSRTAAAILIIAIITASIAWLSPSFARPKKANNNEAKPVKSALVEKKEVNQHLPEESVLVQHLIGDGMIDEVKGFTVEKKQNILIINGQLQTEDVANKYLANLKKAEMHIQVFSFAERLRQHPNAGFIQNLIPVSFSSECVDYGTAAKKPGC